MIVVKLIGGLGNQLFQYAAARRLAYTHNVPLKLDISGFHIYKLHSYSLHHFNIIEDFVDVSDIADFVPVKNMAVKIANRLMQMGTPYYRQNVIKERYFHFDPNILLAGRHVCLEGYWQSEKYFKDIEDIIRNEFTIKDRSDALNTQIACEISARDSVAMHIRRGDYTSDANTNKVHGVSSMLYYRQAIQLVSSRINKLHLYIFTDDPAWAKQEIRFDCPTTLLTHNNADKNYEDLRLMSLCKHNILANSTFSWWGAWLNRNPAKIVIAPKKWFNDKSRNTDDLIPDGWLRL